MKCDVCGAPVENGICTYCGKRFPEPTNSSYTPQPNTGVYTQMPTAPQQKRLREKTWFIILMLFFFFPAGIYLMYKYTSWSPRTKKIVVIAIVVLAVIGMFTRTDSGIEQSSARKQHTVKGEEKKEEEAEEDPAMQEEKASAVDTYLELYNKMFPDKRITDSMVSSEESGENMSTTISFNDDLYFYITEKPKDVVFEAQAIYHDLDENRDHFFEEVQPLISTAFEYYNCDSGEAVNYLDKLKSQRLETGLKTYDESEFKGDYHEEALSRDNEKVLINYYEIIDMEAEEDPHPTTYKIEVKSRIF